MINLNQPSFQDENVIGLKFEYEKKDGSSQGIRSSYVMS
jgi:hypothetical protein